MLYEVTLTSYSSIFWMAIGAVDSRATGTFNKVTLSAITVNIAQVDGTSASAKMGTTEVYCIYV